MLHLSIQVNPKESGLTAFDVSFSLPESAPVPSMLDEGIVYQRPERRIDAKVWAKSYDGIMKVLRYHYGTEPFNIVIS